MRVKMRHFRATQWKQYSAEFTVCVALEAPPPKLQIDSPRLFPKLSGLPDVLPQPHRLELDPDNCGIDFRFAVGLRGEAVSQHGLNPKSWHRQGLERFVGNYDSTYRSPSQVMQPADSKRRHSCIRTVSPAQSMTASAMATALSYSSWETGSAMPG